MATVIAPDGMTSLVRVISSTDQGATFGNPVNVPATIVPPPSPGQVITRCGPAIAAAPDGSIHAAFATYDYTTTPGLSQLLTCSSRDGGRTWTTPLCLAADAQTIYFEPEIAVDSHARVAVMTLAVNSGAADVLLSISHAHQPTFRPPLRVTTKSFDPTVGTGTGPGGSGPYWLGNYQGIAASRDAFHPIWTDTRTDSTQIFTAIVSTAL